MIDLTINPQALERAVQRARERNIIIPTFKQQRDPGLIPARQRWGERFETEPDLDRSRLLVTPESF